MKEKYLIIAPDGCFDWIELDRLPAMMIFIAALKQSLSKICIPLLVAIALRGSIRSFPAS